MVRADAPADPHAHPLHSRLRGWILGLFWFVASRKLMRERVRPFLIILGSDFTPESMLYFTGRANVPNSHTYSRTYTAISESLKIHDYRINNS